MPKKPNKDEKKEIPQDGDARGPVEEPQAEAPIPVMMVSVEEMETLKNDLQKARREAQENSEGWQRERADFANFRKRLERDQALTSQTITINVLKKYLVVLDDMERAVKTRPTEGVGAAWAEGVELILRKLQGILEAEGVTRIPAESELFDPNRHEAITHEPSPAHESGAIIEVLQQGYMLGDRVIRPARVRVAQ